MDIVGLEKLHACMHSILTSGFPPMPMFSARVMGCIRSSSFLSMFVVTIVPSLPVCARMKYSETSPDPAIREAVEIIEGVWI